MTGRKTKRGVGMREVELPDPKDRAAVFAAWDALDASLPRREPGEAGLDAFRRVNAARMAEFLRQSGLPDDPVELRRELATRGFAEDSKQYLAADWLRAWRWWHNARARLLSGDVTAEAVAALADAAEEMGEVTERMWWRAEIDPATGERREWLALRGRKHHAPNTGQQGKTAERLRFLEDLADHFETRNHDALATYAVSEHRRRVRDLWGVGGDKAHAKIMNFLRNHPLPS